MPVQLPDAELSRWCERYLSSPIESILFRTGYLSIVLGCRLRDGRAVVLKARQAHPRLGECHRIQAYLAGAGFPCARPLAIAFENGVAVSAEEMIDGGEALAGGIDRAALYAEALARLVQACAAHRLEVSLDPAPPWLGWEHAGPWLWPPPDDMDLDLNAYSKPAWLDDAAARVAARLSASKLPRVIGHVDWHADNLRWRGSELLAVHDWDSLALLPEAAIAGGASVLYPLPRRTQVSIEVSEAFLAAYEAARGVVLSDEERAVAWAAGAWNRLFDAKKQTVDGRDRVGSLERLQGEMAERLRRAGA